MTPKLDQADASDGVRSLVRGVIELCKAAGADAETIAEVLGTEAMNLNVKHVASITAFARRQNTASDRN